MDGFRLPSPTISVHRSFPTTHRIIYVTCKFDRTKDRDLLRELWNGDDAPMSRVKLPQFEGVWSVLIAGREWRDAPASQSPNEVRIRFELWFSEYKEWARFVEENKDALYAAHREETKPVPKAEPLGIAMASATKYTAENLVAMDMSMDRGIKAGEPVVMGEGGLARLPQYDGHVHKTPEVPMLEVAERLGHDSIAFTSEQAWSSITALIPNIVRKEDVRAILSHVWALSASVPRRAAEHHARMLDAETTMEVKKSDERTVEHTAEIMRRLSSAALRAYQAHVPGSGGGDVWDAVAKDVVAEFAMIPVNLPSEAQFREAYEKCGARGIIHLLQTMATPQLTCIFLQPDRPVDHATRTIAQVIYDATGKILHTDEAHLLANRIISSIASMPNHFPIAEEIIKVWFGGDVVSDSHMIAWMQNGTNIEKWLRRDFGALVAARQMNGPSVKEFEAAIELAAILLPHNFRRRYDFDARFYELCSRLDELHQADAGEAADRYRRHALTMSLSPDKPKLVVEWDKELVERLSVRVEQADTGRKLAWDEVVKIFLDELMVVPCELPTAAQIQTAHATGSATQTSALGAEAVRRMLEARIAPALVTRGAEIKRLQSRLALCEQEISGAPEALSKGSVPEVLNGRELTLAERITWLVADAEDTMTKWETSNRENTVRIAELENKLSEAQRHPTIKEFEEAIGLAAILLPHAFRQHHNFDSRFEVLCNRLDAMAGVIEGETIGRLRKKALLTSLHPDEFALPQPLSVEAIQQALDAGRPVNPTMPTPKSVAATSAGSAGKGTAMAARGAAKEEGDGEWKELMGDPHPTYTFDGLIHVRDLEAFEGPILSEFQSKGGYTYVEKWCTYLGGDPRNGSRTLIVPTEPEVITAYLDKEITMLELLTKRNNDVGFIVDRNGNTTTAVRQVRVSTLPASYLPKPECIHDDSLRPEGLAESLSVKRINALLSERTDLLTYIAEFEAWLDRRDPTWRSETGLANARRKAMPAQRA
jgi:hypothetical protein